MPALTLLEAAARLTVSVSTLRRLIAVKKAPPSFRVGRQIRFRAESVEEWAKQKERK